MIDNKLIITPDEIPKPKEFKDSGIVLKYTPKLQFSKFWMSIQIGELSWSWRIDAKLRDSIIEWLSDKDNTGINQ